MNRVPRIYLAAVAACVGIGSFAFAADEPKGTRSKSGTFVPAEVAKDTPDPEIERKSFKVADGFEVNLWAADPLLAKPIQMNWDAQGRLWVASSSMYPQIKPGEAPTDKVIVLEDADNDGKADKADVFADGLLIPTGVVPGDGGAYVANSTELIHLKDTDNDGKADARRVVLSGFGTEDTHHILHTFRWGNDGRLWFNQSIYIHSHVETPWGVKRLMGSGIWRFHPQSYAMDVFARGMVNPWGHALDRFGVSFSTDGAGGSGIYYTFPGSAFQSAKAWDGFADMPRTLNGMNPGSPKYCGLEIIDGRHLPDDWQGNAITNDFRANRVVRYQLLDENGVYVSKQMPDVITSTDVAFRPIDVKMGPDGAIYIADWYNPIIQHGEVDFRDPRRDKVHGRIWRITAKDRKTLDKPKLVGASPAELLEQLKSPESWTRHQAKIVLRDLGAKAVLPALGDWVKKLDANDANLEHQRLEALWTYQSLDTAEPALLTTLLNSSVPQVRAAATRVVPDWAAELPDAVDLLAKRVADEHPRVRLEAVRSLARMPSPQTIELAMSAMEKPLDQSIEYALWTTVNETVATWLPAYTSGKLTFNNSPKQQTYALLAVNAPEALAALVKQLREGKIPNESRTTVFDRVAAAGNADDLRAVYDIATDAKTDAGTVRTALAIVARSVRQRNVAPAGADASKLLTLTSSNDDSIRIEAMRLAGAWKAAPVRDVLMQAASAENTPANFRQAAVEALAEWGGDNADFLRKLDSADRPLAVRQTSIIGLAAIDLNDAANRAAALFASGPADADPSTLLAAFVQREGGADALAKAIGGGKKLSADVAKLGLRYVAGSGRDLPALTEKLREAAGLGAEQKALTPEQMAAMIKEVNEKGDAARGEAIYRRSDMNCAQCHGIAGAGGQLAPDLRTIGAASPVDYLIDSMIEPAKAIKDGYQSVVIQTKKNEVFSGIIVSRDDKQVVLRDATHDNIVVPVASIRRERAGGSLMPAGLQDALTHTEFLDLIKFLSQLGKPGPYSPDASQVIRRWRVVDGKTAAQLAADATPLQSPATAATLPWQQAYTLVSGVLPADAITLAKGQKVAFARGEIDVTSPGTIGLRFGEVKGLSLWIDGKPVEIKSDIDIDLAKGVHDVTLKVDLVARGNIPLRVEVRDATTGAAGHAQPVAGR